MTHPILQQAEKILEDFPDTPMHYKNQFGLAKVIQSLITVEDIKNILNYVWASGVQAGVLAMREK